MSIEKEGVIMVAKLMALSARTAPKAKGVDVISVRIASGEELKTLAGSMKAFGDRSGHMFFHRDARNIEDSDCCVLIGVKGDSVLSLNCGGCGYPTCGDMLAARMEKHASELAFRGPNCVLRQADLGVAIGSAVKTASMHNVDNRIMFSAGVGALKLGWLEKCTIAYGIPLSASGKSIYFDRK